MSFSDPAFDKPDALHPLGFEPEPAAPRKPHGCFFYGCLIALILLLLLFMGGFLVYRFVMRTIDQYTDTAPETFPAVQMSDADRAALDGRVKVFRDALKAGEPTEPLVLTANELNVLINEDPDVRGRVHVQIEGDKIRGQISVPVLNGRFLNGSADLRVALKDGRLEVYCDQITVKGKPVPEDFMAGFRSQNLAQDAMRDPDTRKIFEKLDSIEVKDGKVIVKGRSKAKDESEAKEKTGAEPSGEAKPEKGAGDKAGAPSGAGGEPEKPKDERKGDGAPQAGVGHVRWREHQPS